MGPNLVVRAGRGQRGARAAAARSWVGVVPSGRRALLDGVEDAGGSTQRGGVQAEGGGHRDGLLDRHAARVEQAVDHGQQPGREFGVVAAEDDAFGVEHADQGEHTCGQVVGGLVEAGQGGGVAGAGTGDDLVDA
ncbi:hypothetical protein AC529_16845 [Thermobifida cellulosilytica TB100]|uniref:Uncharacterized protein n=1 Tax=Thermobifida cellulosilytica TB100 TaxID=665004 RepID=A0A147KE54_THECS|nr:hypothetical protein AC529_16845 [Thermobifida cellulosilytica TB100]